MSGLAVVFGASGSVGAQAALALFRAGFDVVGHHHLNELPAWPEHKWTATLRADLTSADEVRDLAQQLEADIGVPAAVVNCAGSLGALLPLAATKPLDWEQTLLANVRPAYNVARYLLPTMARHGDGSLTNVVSIAAMLGAPGSSPYAASKAAVISLTKTIASEYGRRGVVANALAPGFMETGMSHRVPQRSREAMIERQVLPRPLTPEDLGDAVVYLAKTRSMTGQVMVIDHGFLT